MALFQSFAQEFEELRANDRVHGGPYASEMLELDDMTDFDVRSLATGRAMVFFFVNDPMNLPRVERICQEWPREGEDGSPLAIIFTTANGFQAGCETCFALELVADQELLAEVCRDMLFLHHGRQLGDIGFMDLEMLVPKGRIIRPCWFDPSEARRMLDGLLAVHPCDPERSCHENERLLLSVLSEPVVSDVAEKFDNLTNLMAEAHAACGPDFGEGSVMDAVNLLFMSRATTTASDRKQPRMYVA